MRLLPIYICYSDEWMPSDLHCVDMLSVKPLPWILSAGCL